MLVRLASPEDGLEVGRGCRQDDLVALNKAVFVAGQGHVVEVVLDSHLLESQRFEFPPTLIKSFTNFLPDLRLLHQQRGVSGDSNLLLLAVRQHRLPPVRLASRHGKPAHGFLRVLRAMQKN